MKKVNTRKLAVSGLFTALIAILGFTGIGFIPLPLVNATVMHIPVIIGVILEGPVLGLALGAIFGVASIVRALTVPSLLSFAFVNPIVSVLPRLLIPLVAYGTYRLIVFIADKLNRHNNENGAYAGQSLAAIISGAVGSLANTVFVLGMVYIVYGGQLSEIFGVNADAVGGTVIGLGMAQGGVEAILSAVLTGAVVTAVYGMRHKNRRRVKQLEGS